MIKVSCFKYEDEEDDQGQLIVMYVILVESIVTKKKHILHKRYSDFLELFNSIRELSNDIDKFRFPNKSLFNNRSQFTLERRLEGFNDLLQLAIALKPTPKVLAMFLELSLLDGLNNSTVDWTDLKQGNKSHNNDDYSYNSNNNSLSIIDSPNHGSTIEHDEGDNYDNDNETNGIDNNKERIQIKYMNNHHGNQTQSSCKNDKNIKRVKIINKNSDHNISGHKSFVETNIQNICFCSFVLAIFNYSISVIYGCIDISKTTRGKIVLTVLSISLLFCFIISFSVRVSCFFHQMRMVKKKDT